LSLRIPFLKKILYILVPNLCFKSNKFLAGFAMCDASLALLTKTIAHKDHGGL
jgi:hypothetical protein